MLGTACRLDSEARLLERQLKQCQAAAMSEQAAVRQQLALLTDRAAELEGQLGASQQQQELATVRAKVGCTTDLQPCMRWTVTMLLGCKPASFLPAHVILDSLTMC